MTICPTYPYKLDVLQRNGIKGRNFIQLGAQWLSNDTYTTPEQLYSEVVKPIDEIVHSVRIYLQQEIGGKNIFDLGPRDTICNGETLFRTKPYYWNGDCFGLVFFIYLSNNESNRVRDSFFSQVPIESGSETEYYFFQ